MTQFSKGTKFSLGILIIFVGVLLVWFSDRGDRDSGPEGVRPGFSTWGHVKNQGTDQKSFLKHDSNGLLQVSERESQSRPTTDAIEEFEDWMESFLSEDSSGRGQLIEEGVAISGRRRQEMKRLIREDPETALAFAVPYQFRREFPPEITAQLETPVSNFAQFQLNVYCSDPGHAGHGHAESEYERIAKFGGNRYEVHTFGRRFNVTTKDLLSIHGIAIDEVLAIADDPVRVLSESERADRGFDANIAVVVGGNVYGVADEEAVMRLRTTLEEDEGSLGPLPAAGYRALQREVVEGVSLLFAAEPDEEINFATLSEMPSAPHTLGPKTMLYIRARFSDQEEDFEPIDLATLKDRQSLCEAFWFENSYGKSSLTTTFTDTITLPESANHYKDQSYWLYEHGLPLAKAAGEGKGEDWDPENYDFYTILTDNGDRRQFSGAGVGGRGSTLGGAEASNIRIASHEFGHNLGLHHANYWRTDSTSPIGRDSIPGGYVDDEEGDEWIEYGHIFSVMGNLYDSREISDHRGHYTTGEKVKLDWLVAEDGDWISVDQTTTTPIRLYRHDVEAGKFNSMIPGVARAIKINLDSGDYAEKEKRRYWLSYRLWPISRGIGRPEEWFPYGLQVEWQRETYGSDGSILLDMTPYSDDERGHIDNSLAPIVQDNSDKEDSVLVIGRTYSDEVADIHFTPIARGGETPNEWIDVLINIGTQDENTAPEITSFTASSTEVAPGEIVDFSVEAEDKDGDPLYYSWSFQTSFPPLVVERLNSKTARQNWDHDYFYQIRVTFPVRVTVSDGKGGRDVREIYLEVGDGPAPPAIRGRVTAEGLPVEGAIVKLFSESENSTWETNAWTDSEGNYLLLHAENTESLLTVIKDGFSFRPLFSNPVYLTDVDVTGRDWAGVSNDPNRARVIHLTSPRNTFAKVPDGSGLLIETEISDDHLTDLSGKSNVHWSVVEAPDGGAVTFLPPYGPTTVATFNLPGFYRILISATKDGVTTGIEELTVHAGLIPGENPSSADEIVYFPMDEGEGITVTDSRGGDNNGSLVNGAGWTGPDGGISGTGIVVESWDDRINIPNADEFNLLDRSTRTVALWFKAEDPFEEYTWQVIYDEGGDPGGLNIYLFEGTLFVGAWNIDSNAWETFLSTDLKDTNWHHVAIVLNAPSSKRLQPDAFKGFLDGLEFASGSAATLDSGREGIAIGAFQGTTRVKGYILHESGYGFDGIVDEFHLWNRALSQSEIGQLLSKAYIGPDLTLSSVDYSAGSVVIPPGMGIVLDGNAKGDGSLETKWETVIAPEGVEAIYENSTHPSTLATFSAPGYYKLRLSADDGIQKSAIDVDVHAGLEAGSNFSSPEEVVYYSMNEGSGEIAGNNADRTSPGYLSNPSGWTSEGGGISGTGIQFDGIDDSIRMDSNSLLERNAEKKSFSLWMKATELGTGEKEVVFQIGDRSGGFNIYLDGDVLYFGSWENYPLTWEAFLAVPIIRGKWHHLALVLNADYSGLHPHGLRAYLDGRQVASGSASGMDPFISNPGLGATRSAYPSSTLFHDGLPNNSKRYGFAGILDEFHAYHDHALTIDEIGMLYAFGNIGPTVDSGPNQSSVPAYSIVHLGGSSTDDGRWSSPVTHSWHILDGPEDSGYRLLERMDAAAQFGPLIPGTYRIALGAYDGQVTTFDELMVTVRQFTQFDLFMHGFPAIAVEERGYNADPDGDMWSNLAEYALGGAPDVGETYYQLGLQHELVREAGDWYAEFRYPRRRDAAERGLRYEFEVSDDLSPDSWTNRGYFVLAVTPIDEIFEEVRLTIADPLDSAKSRIFGRVRVVIDE